LRARGGNQSLLKQGKRIYAGGLAILAILVVASAVLGLPAAWRANNWRWVAGATLILDNWLCAPIGAMSINNKLKAIAEEDAGPASRHMIETWDDCTPFERPSGLQRRSPVCGH
jgi:hypothetical protein